MKQPLASAMMMMLACQSGTGQPSLVVHGPHQVRVESLGPVEVPTVTKGQKKVDNISWSVMDEGVARVESQAIVVVGPGQTEVVAKVDGEAVSWELVAELAIVLAFVDAPAVLVVGDIVPLKVVGTVGTEVVMPEGIKWTSSKAEFATVDSGGIVRGVGPGVVYLTASVPSAEATVEIEVLEGADPAMEELWSP
jgi:hypothetical protein